MASSHKKRTGLRAALIVLLCLVLVCAVAAAVLYSFVSRKIKAFQSGASFALDYTITSTEAEPPALYALLDKFGGTTGSLTGQYTPRAVQLALYPTGTSTVNDAPLTRMYISEEETLYDAGQLYNKLRSTVVAEYPLASLLLPGWSLGSYISQNQLATLLGVDPAATGLQPVNDFQLDLKQLKTVQPANAKEGYLYLQLPNLTVIYIKQSLGRLSALCGCVVAATGSSCGITWLMGGNYNQVAFAVQNMIANLTGMICDGAKPSCALKVTTGVSTAVLSAIMAMEDRCVTSVEGIIDEDVDQSIRNLTRIGSQAMNETDKMVLDIMTHKGC